MTFQPYTRTRSWGALVFRSKDSRCRRNSLRKVKFRLRCSTFRINADSASSNMLSQPVGVHTINFYKKKRCRCILVSCFSTLLGTSSEGQPPVSGLGNTEVMRGVKKKMTGMAPFPSGLQVGGMFCKWLEGDSCSSCFPSFRFSC